MQTKEQAVELWTMTLRHAVNCVPDQVQEDVVRALLQQLIQEELDRQNDPYGCGLHIVKVSDVSLKKAFAYHKEEKEAVSLIIQRLVRHVTNNDSPERAARTLFRQHPNGHGSHWLPTYLKGLPGLNVNLTQCESIGDKNGESLLTFEFDDDSVSQNDDGVA